MYFTNIIFRVEHGLRAPWAYVGPASVPAA